MTLILSGTDGLSDIDGSAATPAIRGTDANTGIFFGADIIGFAEGGAEVARFNADAQFVAAAGTALLPVITTTGDVNTGIFFPAADTIAFSEGGVEAMRIDSSGNVGIGTSSPSIGRVEIKDATKPQLSLYGFSPAGATDVSGTIFLGNNSAFQGRVFYDGTTGGVGTLVLENTQGNSSAGIQFKTSATERMRIDGAGNLLVGTTSPLSVGKFSISFDGATKQGQVLRTTIGITGSTYIQFENSAGSTAGYIIQNGTTTVNYVTSSDYRLKEGIAPMTGALAKVAQLKPVTYKWKVDGSDGEGFIAHELAEVCPTAVTREKDAVDAEGNPQYQGIDTSFLVATLTAAIKEQQALITALTARITALETP